MSEMALRRLFGLPAAAVAAVFVAAGAPQAPARPALGPAAGALSDAAGALLAEPGVVRAEAVSVDFEAMRAARSVRAPGAQPTLTLPEFDGESIEVAIDRIDPGVPGRADSYVIVGHVAGEKGSTWAFLSVNGGALYGDVIRLGLPTIQIRPTDGPLHVLREVDDALRKDAPCGCGPEHAVGLAAEGGNPEEESPGLRNVGDVVGPLIDVMVVYTPLARQAALGAPALEAAVANWFAYANAAYENSEVTQRVRLVHIAEIAYTEGDADTDLARLRATSDGHMDSVHATRTVNGADMVHLVSLSTGVCGLAYLMSGVGASFASSCFGLTVYGCGARTFTHELGHNMGCAHDHDNAGSAAYCYAFGHRTSSPQLRTIMAYDPGSPIPYVSNPDLTVSGQVIGVTGCGGDAADNARAMRNTDTTVAAFRTQVHPNPAPGAFSLQSPSPFQTGVDLIPELIWQSVGADVEYNVFVSPNPDLSDPVYSRKGWANTSAFVSAGALTHGTTYYWGVTAFGLATQTNSMPQIASFVTRLRADLNGDGQVNSTDIAGLLGAWGPCPAPPSVCDADLNGDGGVNSSDLSQMLGSWGAP